MQIWEHKFNGLEDIEAIKILKCVLLGLFSYYLPKILDHGWRKTETSQRSVMVAFPLLFEPPTGYFSLCFSGA
jgi:hypothetical protein